MESRSTLTHFFVDDDTLERALTTKADKDYFYSFDVFLTSKDKNLDNLVNYLLKQYIQTKKPTNFQNAKYRRTLKVFLVNLLYCHQSSNKLFLAISRTSGGYSTHDRYNPIGINAKVICNLVDWLKNKNLIIQYKGYINKSGARRTRIRCKTQLINLYKAMNAINAKIISRKDRIAIILRDKNKKLAPYTDNKVTKRMSIVIGKLNSLLLNTKLELNGKSLPFQHIYRVFNDSSFKLGGRFYGGNYLNLPKAKRKSLLINGVTATEFDFSTIHPNILYHEIKKPMPKEPYLPIGYSPNERKFLKEFFLIILNSANEDQAVRAGLSLASREFSMLGYNSKVAIKKVLLDLKTHNKLIQKDFCKCVAKRLMYLDSKIAESVIANFVNQGIPIYPVHDSFIVPVNYGAQLSQVMSACYKKIVGGSIKADKIY